MGVSGDMVSDRVPPGAFRAPPGLPDIDHEMTAEFEDWQLNGTTMGMLILHRGGSVWGLRIECRGALTMSPLLFGNLVEIAAAAQIEFVVDECG